MIYPMKPEAVTMVILHCTGTDIPNQDVAMVTSWHLKRGFDTIGYHWFITDQGEVQAGRPMDVMGAHVEGQNHCSIGVCLAGNKHFNLGQFESLKGLLDLLKHRFPSATLHGHREFNAYKTCPNYEYGDLIQHWNAVQ